MESIFNNFYFLISREQSKLYWVNYLSELINVVYYIENGEIKYSQNKSTVENLAVVVFLEPAKIVNNKVETIENNQKIWFQDLYNESLI